MKKQKVLVFGAGVLGSFYAARLHDAGTDVTLVARGQRLRDLQKHNLVLENFQTGKRSVHNVKLLEQMPTEEYFDLCLVMVQKTQLTEALAAIAVNPHIPTFLFMTNTAEGPQEMIDAVGKERVMFGHVNVGGERDGHVVHFMESQEMTIGELDGDNSQRLQDIVAMFKSANLPLVISKDMDAWKKYHVALVVPFTYAMYAEGGCNYRLAKNPALIRKCWRGIKEAFGVLRSLGYPMEPPKLRWVMMIPEFIIVPIFQRVLKSKIADIGMARHLKNAGQEMDLLTQEFFALAEEAGIKTPIIQDLMEDATRANS